MKTIKSIISTSAIVLSMITVTTAFADESRLNEKNERLKNLSNYGILGVNEGLFTNDCKKVLNIVQSVLLAA